MKRAVSKVYIKVCVCVCERERAKELGSQFSDKMLSKFRLYGMVPWPCLLVWNTGNGDWEWDTRL